MGEYQRPPGHIASTMMAIITKRRSAIATSISPEKKSIMVAPCNDSEVRSRGFGKIAGLDGFLLTEHAALEGDILHRPTLGAGIQLIEVDAPPLHLD